MSHFYSRFFKDVWFKDLPKLTMNNKIRYISLPLDKEKGIIMITQDNIYKLLRTSKEIKKA